MGKEHLTATIDPDVIEKVKKRAKKEKRNLSNMVQVMFEFYLNYNDEKR